MTLYKWSQIAAADATADASINWQEGQAPSSINDSARAMMAATAKYRDDVAGAIVTGGTSTAYTVTSYQAFDTLAHLNGQTIAFTPHATNGAIVTLNVDGLGAKPLRTSPGMELLAGVLIQGTPYCATYNHADQAYYLRGFMGNPYNVPLAGGMDYWGTAVPNSCFAFPAGQQISRATYASLFAIMGTTYGAGDGSTTFNLPDKTGRVSAMRETAATRLTATYFGGNSVNMGAVGGDEKEAIGLGHLPANINSRNSSQAISVATNNNVPAADGLLQFNPPNAIGFYALVAPASVGHQQSSGNNDINVTSNNTGANAPGGARNLATVQPTIICNYIIRVI